LKKTTLVLYHPKHIADCTRGGGGGCDGGGGGGIGLKQ